MRESGLSHSINRRLFKCIYEGALSNLIVLRYCQLSRRACREQQETRGRSGAGDCRSGDATPQRLYQVSEERGRSGWIWETSGSRLDRTHDGLDARNVQGKRCQESLQVFHRFERCKQARQGEDLGRRTY